MSRKHKVHSKNFFFDLKEISRNCLSSCCKRKEGKCSLMQLDIKQDAFLCEIFLLRNSRSKIFGICNHLGESFQDFPQLTENFHDATFNRRFSSTFRCSHLRACVGEKRIFPNQKLSICKRENERAISLVSAATGTSLNKSFHLVSQILY